MDPRHSTVHIYAVYGICTAIHVDLPINITVSDSF